MKVAFLTILGGGGPLEEPSKARCCSWCTPLSPHTRRPCCLSTVIALLAPGQGSQAPGMLAPWLDDPEAGSSLDRWSAATGLDLRRLGTTADADEIKDTAVTQPLIVAASLLAARRIALPDGAPVAGHSIGEVAAAAIAGVFDEDTAVTFAAVRGREMAAACAHEPTGMSAVLGGDPDAVLAALQRLGLEPANRNGAGQVVAAGPLPALAELSEHKPEKARVVALAVAGAFHTRFMAPAEEALRAHAATISPADPARPLLSNADGTVVADGTEVLARLVAQVTRPVRWDACMATLRGLGVTGVVELPPAGALVGLVKRELKGTATLALKSPDDVEKADMMIKEHG